MQNAKIEIIENCALNVNIEYSVNFRTRCHRTVRNCSEGRERGDEWLVQEGYGDVATR